MSQVNEVMSVNNLRSYGVESLITKRGKAEEKPSSYFIFNSIWGGGNIFSNPGTTAEY